MSNKAGGAKTVALGMTALVVVLSLTAAYFILQAGSNFRVPQSSATLQTSETRQFHIFMNMYETGHAEEEEEHEEEEEMAGAAAENMPDEMPEKMINETVKEHADDEEEAAAEENHEEEEEAVEYHRWVPSAIAVNVGDTVILNVTNADTDATHGFGIAAISNSDGEPIKEILEGGESTLIQFTADRSGVYLFRCVKEDCTGDHEEQIGQIIVLG